MKTSSMLAFIACTLLIARPSFAQFFTDNFSPPYTNNWSVIDNGGGIPPENGGCSASGHVCFTYTPDGLQWFADTSLTATNLASNIVFSGDIDVSFTFYHAGSGRTNVGIINEQKTTTLALAALDTDDTNYLNFIVPTCSDSACSTEYEFAGTPYMNRWTTVRIKVQGTDILFYADVDNPTPTTLLKTLHLSDAHTLDSFRLWLDVHSAPWKSGPNTTTFQSVTTQVGQPCQLTVAPLYQGCLRNDLTNCDNCLSNDAPWSCTIYDHDTSVTDTISRWGCNLTACAMVVNYHAASQNVAFSTTPDQLNSWLNGQPDGWTANGGPNRYAVARYACQNGVLLKYDGDKPKRSDSLTDSYLCASKPVILWVDNAQHFVLATGKDLTSGKYLINDPGSRQNHDLSTYGDTYAGIFPFSGNAFPSSALRIVGHSPIELVLTDPAGNKTGVDPTSGETFDQIAGASYATESIKDDADPDSGATTDISKVLDVSNPTDGIYILKVIGTGADAFHIDFDGYDLNGEPSVSTISGNAIPGLSSNYTVNYSSLAGSQISVVNPNKCPLKQGVWKNSTNTWPLSSMILGAQTYTTAETVAILRTSTKKDASLILARQLIATKLNIANGSNPEPISATVNHADALLSTYGGKLPYAVKPSSTAGRPMVEDSNQLDSYNSGALTSGCTL
jgi:hypothetical protein